MLHSFLYIYNIYKHKHITRVCIYLGLTVLKYNRSYIRAHPTVVEFYKRLGMSQVSANNTAAAQAAYKWVYVQWMLLMYVYNVAVY